MDAAEESLPSVSEPLTWAEICARYPDQHVCLVEIDDIHPRGFAFRTARVAGHGKTRREAHDRARSCWDRYREIGSYFTGRSTKPLIRPALILDDETRDLFRIRR